MAMFCKCHGRSSYFCPQRAHNRASEGHGRRSCQTQAAARVLPLPLPLLPRVVACMYRGLSSAPPRCHYHLSPGRQLPIFFTLVLCSAQLVTHLVCQSRLFGREQTNRTRLVHEFHKQARQSTRYSRPERARILVETNLSRKRRRNGAWSSDHRQAAPPARTVESL